MDSVSTHNIAMYKEESSAILQNIEVTPYFVGSWEGRDLMGGYLLFCIK